MHLSPYEQGALEGREGREGRLQQICMENIVRFKSRG
jgi:hypothetical protein